ncbi:hypothetical protein IQ10_01788 [Halalkalibacter nanhaiisediminis]|uniref:Uncharacterized protein n=1 Tax=Halalkalibacter nanhaiisediminis TaxID=688079 RepID=A0A562QK49_9BACI|nr:hypothetical protein IQ10_01788 [Halalkalibacter nanhaiisediminis]
MIRRHFHKFHHHPRPSFWWKVRGILVQILLPLIFFQLIRTLLLPTTFDVILLTLMIVLYCALLLRLL